MLNAISTRPTFAEIDLAALAFNLRSARDFIGSKIKYLAVVKANAYGHGAVECAKRFELEGVDWFGVALPEEGFELREAGIDSPILCLGGFWNGQEDALLANRITPVISRLDQAESLDRSAAARSIIADIHVKIDTGMGRLGVPQLNSREFGEKLRGCKNLRLQGMMTHFAVADDISQNDFTDSQIAEFAESVAIFRGLGFAPEFVDLANSPGAVAHPAARGNMVRLGGILYGLGRDVLPIEVAGPELKPVMSLRTEISHLKTVPAQTTLGYGRTFTTKRRSLIATIPIGYADGYPRSLSNVGNVVVNGSMAPVVGRVSMDWTIIDVTDISEPMIGSDVILMGNAGGISILAEDIALQTDTISYEITCGVSARVPKKFKE